jgi:hypothetical protein
MKSSVSSKDEVVRVKYDMPRQKKRKEEDVTLFYHEGSASNVPSILR